MRTRTTLTTTPRAGAVLFARDVERLVTFYSALLALPIVERGDDQVVLESSTFQLVIHGIPPGIASTPELVPPDRRAAAAIKPVFFVPSIAELRGSASALGGFVKPNDLEWTFRGTIVCDAVDPEGNVIQFRQPAHQSYGA